METKYVMATIKMPIEVKVIELGNFTSLTDEYKYLEDRTHITVEFCNSLPPPLEDEYSNLTSKIRALFQTTSTDKSSDELAVDIPITIKEDIGEVKKATGNNKKNITFRSFHSGRRYTFRNNR